MASRKLDIIRRSRSPFSFVPDAPEDQLQLAVSEFKSKLGEKQKANFRQLQSSLSGRQPRIDDVLQFTAELDAKYRDRTSQRKFTNQLMNVLLNIQALSGAVDVIVGGTQNIIATSIWGVLKMSLQLACGRREFLNKLADLLMNVGRRCPDYKQFAEMFSHSTELKSRLCLYLITVVQLCQEAVMAMENWTHSIRSSIDSTLSNFENSLKVQGEDFTSHVSLLISQRNEQYRESDLAHAFLNACSCYDHENSFREALSRGSSNWVQQLSDYKEWINSPESAIFWLTGKLGCGKTVTAASIISSLISRTQVSKSRQISYFFCKFDDITTLNARTIIGSLSRQLLSCDGVSWRNLNFDRNLPLRDDRILEILQGHLPRRNYEYFVVIDGLDQCQRAELSILGKFIKQLVNIPISFKICLVCRPLMLNWLKILLQPQWAIHIIDDRPEIEHAINTAVQEKIDNEELLIGSSKVAQIVKATLLRKCEGMLLWVSFQIELLCRQRTDQGILDCLETLPQGLKKTFDEILLWLSDKDYPDHSAFCKRTFEIVASAQRPLSLQELREALNVEPGDREWNEHGLINDMRKTMEQFGSLLLLDEVKETVHFAHHTVKDHLLSTPSSLQLTQYHSTAIESELMLGRICVTYLSHRRFEGQLEKVDPVAKQSSAVDPVKFAGPSIDNLGKRGQLMVMAAKIIHGTGHENQTRARLNYPIKDFESPTNNSEGYDEFLSYAQSYWLMHTKFLIPDKTNCFYLWSRLLSGDVKTVQPPWSPEFWQLLGEGFLQWAFGHDHVALLREVLSLLLSNPLQYQEETKRVIHKLRQKQMEMDRAPAYFGLALQIVIRVSDMDLLAQILKMKDIEVNAEGGMCGSALGFASMVGNKRAAGLLLEHGALPNYRGLRDDTALQIASNKGHLGVVKTLLEWGADIDQAGKQYGNALQAAAEGNKPEIVEYLLQRGADANTTGGTLGTPLQAAAACSDLDTVKMLLRHGANINSVGGTYGSPLNAGLQRGRDDIVECLLGEGASTGAGSLPAAAAGGLYHIVDFLLQNGFDCNAADEDGMTALSHAAARGDVSIVHLLLRANAHVDGCQDGGIRQTPLACAARYGHCELVELFIQNKADINPLSQGLPLNAAVLGGSKDIVEKLLIAGANVNGREPTELAHRPQDHLTNHDSQTALRNAIHAGHHEVVKILLSYGADITVPCGPYNNALFAATDYGEEDIVDTLLDYGATIRVVADDGKVWDALERAKFWKHTSIISKLESRMDSIDRR